MPWVVLVLLCSGLIVLAGCSNNEESVDDFIERIKREQSGEIEPIAEIQHYAPYDYKAAELKSPFEPAAASLGIGGTTDQAADDAVRPDPQRVRRELEDAPLDSFTMVGTLQRGGETWALVLDRNGLIHRVKAGDYIGQNSGKITEVTESSIYLTERIADGQGGWFDRKVTIILSE